MKKRERIYNKQRKWLKLFGISLHKYQKFSTYNHSYGETVTITLKSENLSYPLINNHTGISAEKVEKMVNAAKNRCQIVMDRPDGIEEIKERKIKLEGRSKFANGVGGDYDHYELIEINKILNND
ncbi:MAG: hypothetical protein V4538_15005 [Bacteroidota bacterium]